jgi:3-isopropylmalate/(R)-2-methylmalate dehydratase small subunit
MDHNGMSARPIAGRVFKYGDAINTDLLFAGKYTYTLHTPEEAAPHALEDLDADFAKTVRPGDVVVAGTNFGCGSSREQAVTCLKALGVGAVVAKSIARIYFRNAINSGLPAITCPAAVDALEAGDAVAIDLDAAFISTPKGRFAFAPLDPGVRQLLRAGGLIPYVRERLAAEER